MCRGTGSKKGILVNGRDDYPRIVLVERSQAAMEATAYKALEVGIIRRIVGQPQRLRYYPSGGIGSCCSGH